VTVAAGPTGDPHHHHHAPAAAGHSPEAMVADVPPAAAPPAHDAPRTDHAAPPDHAPRAGGAPRTDAFSAPTMVLPLVSSGTVITPGMDLPLPDEDAGPAARERLAGLDLNGAGLGALAGAVEFAARTQGTPTPRPWRSVRVILLHGGHAGGAVAGADPRDLARRAAEAHDGHGPLARLAAAAGAAVHVVDAPPAGAMEDDIALDPAQVDAALRQGWDLADRAVDAGADALVLAAYSAGAEAAAAAVVAATTGAEPVTVLGRVLVPGGYVDDEAWMLRCAAVRDALHRIRQSPRGARDILSQLGGGDVAVATGVLLGAAARRVPVLVDGPVGAAAGLVARDFAYQTRHWCLLADDGGQPAVRQAADVLGLDTLVDLRLDLGEGANALAALPLLNAAIELAGSLGAHPNLEDASAFAGPAGDPGSTDTGA
jgi:NaMN:DMB phosphoribosyltransferase